MIHIKRVPQSQHVEPTGTLNSIHIHLIFSSLPFNFPTPEALSRKPFRLYILVQVFNWNSCREGEVYRVGGVI